jgi:aromatic ring hydroxylase
MGRAAMVNRIKSRMMANTQQEGASSMCQFGEVGRQYLRSRLSDGRTVIIDGAVIADVANHSAFKGIVSSLETVLESHNADGRSPYLDSYLVPKDGDDLRRRGEAFTWIARQSGGLMARTPDFLASLLAAWFAARSVFGRNGARYAENIEAYYRYSLRMRLCHSHAISDPAPDRYVGTSKSRTLTLRKVGETKDGIIVTGAKMLATLAPVSDELLVYPFRPLAAEDEAAALVFAVPISTPGLKLLCRTPLGEGNSQFERPLSERFDEMDALCLFDNVLIPHERVFLDGDVQLANDLRARTGMLPYIWHQTTSRVSVKSKFVLGLAYRAAKMSGRFSQTTNQEMLGELAANSEALEALVEASVLGATVDAFGSLVPAISLLGAANVMAPKLYARSIEVLRHTCESGLMLHASEEDIGSSCAYLDNLAPSNGDIGTYTSVMKIASELAMGAYGGRQLLYEDFYLGPPQALKQRYINMYDGWDDAESLVDAIAVPARPSLHNGK